MDAEKKSTESVQASKGLNQAVINLLNSHVSLLSIELEEAKRFYVQCFIRMAILVTFGLLFLMLFSMGVIAYFWDTHRMVAIICSSLACLLVMLGAGLSLFSLNKKTQLFVATKEELVKDKAIFYE